MLKISRELDLGLLLMGELNKKDNLSLAAWAEEKKLPYRFLCKIANKLKKAKLIKAQEGRSGGYKLVRSSQKIKVGEIFEAIEGKIKPVKCLQGKKCASQEFCTHKDILAKLSLIMEKELHQISLDKICR